MKKRSVCSKVYCSFCRNIKAGKPNLSVITKCVCKELRSWSIDYTGRFSPTLVISENYTHELFKQYFKCYRCNGRVSTCSPKGLASIAHEVMANLPVTFFYRSTISDSMRNFIAKNAQHFKTMEEFARAIQESMTDEFYFRLVNYPKHLELPAFTFPKNHRNLLKSVRELEFYRNENYITYKRELLWSQ